MHTSYCHYKEPSDAYPVAPVAYPTRRRLNPAPMAFSVGLLVLCGSALAVGGPGEIDPSFGGSGAIAIEFGGAFDGAAGLLIQPDGNILAMGTGGSSNRCAIARVFPDGYLDGGFNGTGTRIFDQSAPSGAMLLQPDGKIVVAMPYLGGAFGFMVQRLNEDGTMDAGFGTGGKGTVGVGSQPNVESIDRQSDGKIIVAGYSYFAGNWDWAITRFNANGTPDASFGVVQTDMGSATDDRSAGAVVLPDDKILACGYTKDSQGRLVMALARYLPGGGLDSGFGNGGKLVVPYDPVLGGGILEAMIAAPNGKFLAAGSADGIRSMVVRFDANGNLDAGFGSNGRALLSTGNQNNWFSGVAVDPVGRVVAAGTATISNVRHPVLVRFSADGVVDTGFGDSGKVVASFGTNWEQGGAVASARDGRIILGGEVGTANVDTDMLLARYTPGPIPGALSIQATGIEGEATTEDGFNWIIEDGDYSVNVFYSNFVLTERRGILEFDLAGVPSDAHILSARLDLEVSTFTSSSSGYPFLGFNGYAGNGALNLSDVYFTPTFMGLSDYVTDLGPISIPLYQGDFIESLLGDPSPYLGLMAFMAPSGFQTGFYTTESAAIGQPRPTLTIEYLPQGPNCDPYNGGGPDCNTNGVADHCDIDDGTSQDCNTNGIPDECDISGGASQDCQGNGIPDDCEPDADGDGIPDDCDTPNPGDRIKALDLEAVRLARHPFQDVVYATLPNDNSVAVIHTQDFTYQTVPVGVSPLGVAVSPDGGKVFVCNSGEYSISVIDTATLGLLTPIPAPEKPSDIEVGLSGRLFATAVSTSYRKIMHLDSNTGADLGSFDLFPLSIYGRGFLEISADRRTLYFGNTGLSPATLASIDVSTHTPALLLKNEHGALGSNGQDVALSNDGRFVVFACGSGNADIGYGTFKLNTADFTTVCVFDTPAYPIQFTFSPDDAVAYGTSNLYDEDAVVPYDAQTCATPSLSFLTAGEVEDTLTDRSGAYLFAATDVTLDIFYTGRPPLIPGDADHDGDVDADDLESFRACSSGPAVPFSPACAWADSDGDLDVDQVDFAPFQRCYGGENNPVDPDCAN